MPRVYNFSAGPAQLPEPVLKRAASELADYNGTGMSVMEMSHRSKDYDAIIRSVEEKLRTVMAVPEGYKVLFLQGGATMQFAGIPLNLIARSGKADYALTGEFSSKAYKEGARYGEMKVAATTADSNFSRIPRQEELCLDPDAAYFHYCMNNTVFGTKWSYIPETGSVPLVCDMSSCILSEPLELSRFGLIYAGAQKNMGPAGLTVVIVNEELVNSVDNSNKPIPDVINYAKQIKSGSMLNTPPTYGIYLLGLVLDWVTEQGGLDAMREHNTKKAALLYEVLDGSKLFKSVVEPESRSIMNVTFRTGSDELDAAFIKAAAASGLVTLKGHRATGGMRASIYNAMPLEGVQKLAALMREFEKNNS